MEIERVRVKFSDFGLRAWVRRLLFIGAGVRKVGGADPDLAALKAVVTVNGVAVAGAQGWRPDDGDPGVCIGGFSGSE